MPPRHETRPRCPRADRAQKSSCLAADGFTNSKPSVFSQALPIAKRPSFYALAKGDLIKVEPGGFEIGRDPRKVPRETLAKYHTPMPVLKAIRAKCIDCSGGNADEVRKCTALACPLWPFRMGTNPHRDTSNYSGAGGFKPGKIQASAAKSGEEVLPGTNIEEDRTNPEIAGFEP
jgi:hypothetical protein